MSQSQLRELKNRNLSVQRQQNSISRTGVIIVTVISVLCNTFMTFIIRHYFSPIRNRTQSIIVEILLHIIDVVLVSVFSLFTQFKYMEILLFGLNNYMLLVFGNTFTALQIVKYNLLIYLGHLLICLNPNNSSRMIRNIKLILCGFALYGNFNFGLGYSTIFVLYWLFEKKSWINKDNACQLSFIAFNSLSLILSGQHSCLLILLTITFYYQASKISLISRSTYINYYLYLFLILLNMAIECYDEGQWTLKISELGRIWLSQILLYIVVGMISKDGLKKIRQIFGKQLLMQNFVISDTIQKSNSIKVADLKTPNKIIKPLPKYNFDSIAINKLHNNIYAAVIFVGLLYNSLEQNLLIFVVTTGIGLVHPSKPLYQLAIAFISTFFCSTLLSFHKNFIILHSQIPEAVSKYLRYHTCYNYNYFMLFCELGISLSVCFILFYNKDSLLWRYVRVWVKIILPLLLCFEIYGMSCIHQSKIIPMLSLLMSSAVIYGLKQIPKQRQQNVKYRRASSDSDSSD